MMINTVDLWVNYKKVLDDVFPEFKFDSRWCEWKGKNDLTLTADIFTAPHFIKSRRVDIQNDKSSIYNNVIYPKTGHNLPCFGMDLMGFFQKKVIIVFDFQHPVERHVFSVDGLPEAEKEYRFFEMGNHFSKNIFVRYCTFDEVDYYLPEFRLYLETYRKMIDDAKPTGEDISFYQDFDTYMKKLDPILGYMSSNFGEDNANLMMDEFFFPYAI
tara:strand:- start:536 stop:1177 length:642 start_codon:yes stop_codon:yes gene_type:complete